MDIGHEPSLIPPEPRRLTVDEEWALLKEVAGRLGAEDGEGAPALLDLSGQWADEPTPRDIVRRVFGAADLDVEDWPSFDQVDWCDILDAYEEAYNEAANIEEE